MGRIKTMLIKRVANKLFRTYPDRFNTKFEDNKLIVGELDMLDSKKMRNVIAGYVTRLVKQKKKEEAMLLKDSQKLITKVQTD